MSPGSVCWPMVANISCDRFAERFVRAAVSSQYAWTKRENVYLMSMDAAQEEVCDVATDTSRV
jgi:hypothetical protein